MAETLKNADGAAGRFQRNPQLPPEGMIRVNDQLDMLADHVITDFENMLHRFHGKLHAQFRIALHELNQLIPVGLGDKVSRNGAVVCARHSDEFGLITLL